MRKSVERGVDDGEKTMAEKLGMGTEVRELKLGQSFTGKKSPSFHTLRYDFKPASVDTSKEATVAVGENHQITVTVPHMDGAGTPQTIFKGNHKPYQKECVLIIDRNTGQITLEKLTSNLQVKKTRTVPKQVSIPSQPPVKDASKTITSTAVNKRGTHRKVPTRAKSRGMARAQQMASSLSTMIPRHSPLHASPSYPQRKSPHVPAAASLPVIETGGTPGTSPAYIDRTNDFLGQVSSLSESSSSSSDSSDTEKESSAPNPSYKNSGAANGTSLPVTNLLNEDLRLSESGSDD